MFIPWGCPAVLIGSAGDSFAALIGARAGFGVFVLGRSKLRQYGWGVLKVGAGPSGGDMLRVAFALLLSLGVVTPAAAQQGALIGNDSTGDR